jgi:hypothetical protein
MLIEALSSTASLTQANALKDLLYRHLMGETSIGVYIPVSLLSKTGNLLRPMLMLLFSHMGTGHSLYIST